MLECKLNPLVNYTTLSKTIDAQKVAIDLMIIQNISQKKDVVSQNICYSGSQGVIPGNFIRESFPQCNFSNTLADFEDHSMQLKPKLEIVLNVLQNSAFGHFWEMKMNDEPKLELPIQMDLPTICERVKRGYYRNLWTFHAEMVWLIKTLKARIRKLTCVKDCKLKLFELKAFENMYCNELEGVKLLSITNRKKIIQHSP